MLHVGLDEAQPNLRELTKAFGQAGAGLFVAPTAIAAHVCDQYGVAAVGHIGSVVEQLYAITTERQLSHPAIMAISKTARQDVFGGGKLGATG